MRKLLKDYKYAKAIIAMGMNHGRDFDCMSENCPVCKPYRIKEREEWQNLSQEEKQKVHWGVIG